MVETQSQSGPGANPSQAAQLSDDPLRLLVNTGLLLASERSLDVIVQAALEAGRQLCKAAFGLFVRVRLTANLKRQQLVSATGLDASRATAIAPLIDIDRLFRDHLPSDSQPQNTTKHRPVRIADIYQLPPHQQPCIFTGFAEVCSYLAVPVYCRDGDLLGALIYGHPSPGVFTAEGEDLVATIASQAAVAIENFRLANNLTHEISIADAARALQRQTADRLRQALDAAQLGTFTWDRDTDLLDLDDRARHLFAVAPGEQITRTALREHIVVPEDLPATTDRLNKSLESGTNYYAEYRIYTRAGEPTWIAASGINTYAPGSNKIIGMVGTVQDITSRRNQEETLRQSEKLAATGRLAATIAHEINNPLEAITNLIYLARTDPDIPAPVQGLLETADSELARVSQIAQQTLGFYRDTTRPVIIDINNVLIGIVDLFQRKMRSKSLTHSLDLQPGITVFGLQGEIRQVFSNLLVNAIDASHQSNLHIRTRLRKLGGKECAIVMICDQGSGIPASVRDRLFTPFVTSKETVGTGLGLWVTRGIVEKQGGRIGFRTSVHEPCGTVFRVVLPVRPPS